MHRVRATCANRQVAIDDLANVDENCGSVDANSTPRLSSVAINTTTRYVRYERGAIASHAPFHHTSEMPQAYFTRASDHTQSFSLLECSKLNQNGYSIRYRVNRSKRAKEPLCYELSRRFKLQALHSSHISIIARVPPRCDPVSSVRQKAIGVIHPLQHVGQAVPPRQHY